MNMNVFSLPARNRSIGITDVDTRLASRFIFARPGWHLAERLNGQREPYLEVTFSPIGGTFSLGWHLLRHKSGIAIGDPGSDSVIGPYTSVHDALLRLWEEAEAFAAKCRPAPVVVLYGLDTHAEIDLQHLIAEADMESMPASKPDQAVALLANGRVAAAIIDLHLPPQHCDAREAVRRMRQCRPGLPVLALTTFAPTAPEADLHGLGGPTHRESLPCDAGAVSRWLSRTRDAHLADKSRAESEPG